MIAKVLVDVKAREVDRTFDYLVPSKLEDVIEIGQRVKVPFGPRFIMGYVLGFTERSEFDKLKKIYAVMDIIPSLTKELIKLGKELSISNTSSLVGIYQAMLPKALKSKYKKKLNVVDSELLSTNLSVKFNRASQVIYDKELVAYLKEIKENIKSGNIFITYEIRQANNEKFLKKIKLINPNIVLKGAKQVLVLEFLKENIDVYKRDLMSKFSLAQSTIKSLVDKGVIEEYSIETYRKVESLFAPNNKSIVLNYEQVNVYNEIVKEIDNNKVFLLHGVTGSGKTEIYLNIIEDVLAQGKEAIMLVPEISLTPMMVSRFKGRFKDDVAVLHSGLSIGEKYDEWRKIRRKEVSVVVGARSAIFAPFTNLGVIIIDEEHSDSYKQSTLPTYQAKDVAILRCNHYNIPLILGSATPSVESYYKALNKEYKLLEMKYRANNAQMPEVYIEDMRFEFKGGNRSIFSKKLDELITDRLAKKEQIILLLNRRGHSTFVMCRSCGEVIMCPNCDISLTYHEKTNSLKCHYCGHDEANPSVCPKCGSKYIRYMGIGTQRVEEFIHERFPTAKVVRMDTDTTNYKGAHEKLLYDFEFNGDILLGTQMISKGLDFPKVSLVGVLAADMSLSLPDYKAIEKTFQLLTQVSGRAGRHNITGEVVIQTYNPDHYAIMYAKSHDYHSFYETEMNIRKIAGYTPFYNLVQIIVSDKDVRNVLREGTKIVMRLRKELDSDVNILGPVLPKISRINNYFRAQIIIKYKESEIMDDILKKVYYDFNEVLSLSIDKNPTLL